MRSAAALALLFGFVLSLAPIPALAEIADGSARVVLTIPRHGEPILRATAVVDEGDAEITHVWIEVAGHRILNLRATATPTTWKGQKRPVIFDDQTPVSLWVLDASSDTFSLPLACTLRHRPRGVIKIVCIGNSTP